MPRKLRRYTGRGDLNFLTFSCYERRPLLQSQRAKTVFLQILGKVRSRYRFRLIGYVVMPEHIHLVIGESPTVSPATVLQVMKQRVSRALREKQCTSCSELELCFAEDLAERRRFWQRRYYDFKRILREEAARKAGLHASESSEARVGEASVGPTSPASAASYFFTYIVN